MIRLPDTFVERVIQVASTMPEPNADTTVLLSSFEASTIRRAIQEEQYGL